MSEQKSYRDKLLDPRWQRKRLEIFQRDDFTCRHCGDNSKTLHVHHHYYAPNAEPWEYHESALVTLCCDCHEEQEAHKSDSAMLSIHLNCAGFMNTDLAAFGCAVRGLAKYIQTERIHLLILHLDRSEQFRNSVLDLYNQDVTRYCENAELPF